MVGVLGLEPRISWSQTMRLSQLGHTPFRISDVGFRISDINLTSDIWIPTSDLVPRERIELSTQGFSVLCSTTELPRLFRCRISDVGHLIKSNNPKSEFRNLKSEICCGSRIRTYDLQVMGLASCQLLYPAAIKFTILDWQFTIEKLNKSKIVNQKS